MILRDYIHNKNFALDDKIFSLEVSEFKNKKAISFNKIKEIIETDIIIKIRNHLKDVSDEHKPNSNIKYINPEIFIEKYMSSKYGRINLKQDKTKIIDHLYEFQKLELKTSGIDLENDSFLQSNVEIFNDKKVVYINDLMKKFGPRNFHTMKRRKTVNHKRPGIKGSILNKNYMYLENAINFLMLLKEHDIKEHDIKEKKKPDIETFRYENTPEKMLKKLKGYFNLNYCKSKDNYSATTGIFHLNSLIDDIEKKFPNIKEIKEIKKYISSLNIISHQSEIYKQLNLNKKTQLYYFNKNEFSNKFKKLYIIMYNEIHLKKSLDNKP